MSLLNLRPACRSLSVSSLFPLSRYPLFHLQIAMASGDRPILKFKRLTENAFAPKKGSKRAAGFDLMSAYDYTVPAKDRKLVLTDLQIEIPDGCYGRVAPRSGLAVKHSIDVGAGVVDSDYRGNVGIVLFNFGNDDFIVNKGDRVAQLICEKIEYPELEEEKENMSQTERGSGGFGSTGVNGN